MATFVLSAFLSPNPNPNPNPNFPFLHPKSPPLPLSRTSKLHSIAPQTPPPNPVLSTSPISEDSSSFDWFDHWYPFAPLCDLDRRVPHGKRVLGLDVVAWWDRERGAWRVFDDKCPHRLAPLSEGRIDKWGRLQCVYHGWCFGGEGECRLIPQAPVDGPPIHTVKKACASVYPCIEQNKILWFWPSTDAKYKDIAQQKKPPYIPELDNPSFTSTMGIRDIPYGYEVLIENLMDPSHVPYAHYGLMRSPNKKNSVSVDREGGKPLDITIDKLDSSGFFGKQDIGYSKFVAPCLFYAFPPNMNVNKTSGTAENLEKDQLASQKKQPRFLLIFICIPVSPGRSRLIWVFPRNVGVWIDKVVPRWLFHVGQNLILDSDLYLLHLEEQKIAEIGPNNWQKACYVPTKADALVVGFRKWLRKYSNGHIDWGKVNMTALPPTPPREQLMDRYRSHVLQCTSCHAALKSLKILEVVLQVASIASIGIAAAVKESVMSVVTRSIIISAAIIFFLASRWLSHFIYKNFYYHDYNHALV